MNSYVFHHQEGLYDIFEVTPPYAGTFIFQIFGSHKVYSMDPDYLTNLAIFEVHVASCASPVGLVKNNMIFIEKIVTNFQKILLKPKNRTIPNNIISVRIYRNEHGENRTRPLGAHGGFLQN